MVKNNQACTKCIHSSLTEREDSLCQTLWLAICKDLSYTEVKDRYTEPIDRDLASTDQSQLHHRNPIIDYDFNCVKNIVQHKTIS